MVSKKFKLKILDTIGRDTIEKFQDFLINKGQRNRNGHPFSKSSIRNYVYSENLNKNLDPFFLEFSETEIQKIEEIMSKTQKISNKTEQIA